MRDQASSLRRLVAGDQPVSLVNPGVPAGHGSARVIAVTSGKGGVGKTMLTVNLALLLAELPAGALIVDADLGLANVDVMLGVEPGRHIGHLLLAGCLTDEVAATGPGGIKVISGGSGLQELADASRADRLMLLEKLHSYYENFDYVLVDTSPGIGPEVTDFLRGADDLLLVTTPEPTSLRDTYAALKAITREMPGREVIIVVNCAAPGQAEQAIEALNHVARKFLERECKRWYHVEQDALVCRTIRDRKPLARAYPRSPAAVCLRRLAKALVRSAPAVREAAYALA